jgi:hypothetical protein
MGNMNLGRGLYNMLVIALVVVFWIPLLKLLMLKFPIPGFADLVAMV